MKIIIGHIYPDLLNLYGDRGNIAALSRRLIKRDIEVEIKTYAVNEQIDFENLDIIIIGGGSDRDMLIANESLKKQKGPLKEYVENNGCLLALCGGFHILGNYFEIENNRIEGLGILDICTNLGKKRLIGNVILQSDIINHTIVGFENHNGLTQTGDYKPLGIVKFGNGNNGSDQKEGLVYKNLIASNLHGPILPKNTVLTDYLIKNSLTKKYGEVSLVNLDDTLENNAHNYIINRYLK